MNKAQVREIKAQGYTFGEVPGLHQQPRATYYTNDKNTGEIVKMPNLPADPYSLSHYLRKGFVLNPSDLKSQAQEDFVCSVCGKSFTTHIALQGHLRSHK